MALHSIREAPISHSESPLVSHHLRNRQHNFAFYTIAGSIVGESDPTLSEREDGPEH